jgi:hypothetical protein
MNIHHNLINIHESIMKIHELCVINVLVSKFYKYMFWTSGIELRNVLSSFPPSVVDFSKLVLLLIFLTL